MRVFVTGATGFAGSHLVERLVQDGHTVFAMVHNEESRQRVPQHPSVFAVDGDLLDAAALKTAVLHSRPDLIFHLAGQPFPGQSWRQAALTLAVNSGGTANLLDAAVAWGRPRVVVVTSAEIYGRLSTDDLPVTEATPPQPRHPYGVSKQAAGELVRLYWERYQLPVVEARPFNHIGPGQALGFVATDFASQLAAIKLGQQPPLMRVGNLEALRDFSDVRDVVHAYTLLADSGQPGEAYLISSGQPVSVQYLLNTLLQLVDRDVVVEYDPARMRPSDVPILYGSAAKLTAATGWQPRYTLAQSLTDVFADWMDRLGV